MGEAQLAHLDTQNESCAEKVEKSFFQENFLKAVEYV